MRTRFPHLPVLLAALAVLGGTTSVAYAQSSDIDTTPEWNPPTTAFSPFGKLREATIGQTFTIGGSEKFLDSFSFFLNPSDDDNPTLFRGYLAEWDTSGKRAKLEGNGQPLFTSANKSTVPGSGFLEYKIFTGSIELDSSKTYVAFLSASERFGDYPTTGTGPNARNGTATVGQLNGKSAGSPVSSNGLNALNFVKFDNGEDYALLFDTTESWDVTRNGIDAAFKADFSESFNINAVDPVPEPGAIATGIIMFGTTGLGMVRGRLRRRTKAA